MVTASPSAPASAPLPASRPSGGRPDGQARPRPGLARGWDPKSFSGVRADYFVDAACPTSGDGACPATAFRTVAEAIARVAADGRPRTVAVIGDNAIYRERIVLKGCDGLTLRGFGTDKPTITGQEPLTGWVRCAQADAPDLGPNFASIWKTTVENDAMAVGATAINLYEADQAVPVCQVRPPGADLFFRFYDRDFVRADAFLLDGAHRITGIRDRDVLAGLSARHLVGRAYVVLYGNPNTVSRVAITAFDGAATIAVGGRMVVQRKTADPDPDHLRWNLCNCLPTMAEGTHGALDNGDGTTTIYVWPRDTAHLAGAMSYAARSDIIDASETSGVTIEGLRLIGTAGDARQNGQCVRARWATDTTLRHCLIGDISHSAGGYGAVWAQQTRNFRLERCDLRNIDGAFTAFFQQGPNDVWSTGTVVRQNRAYRLSQTAFRFYGQRDVQMVFNDAERTGFGGHSNAWNFYMGCDRVLIYGNKFRNVVGYGTWQDSSRIFIGMNLQQQSLSAHDNRALQDQTRLSRPTPSPGATNYVWNNHILPDPADPGTATSTSLGKAWVPGWDGPDATHPFNNRFVFVNNIAHGGGVVEPYKPLRGKEQRWEDRPGFGRGHIERDRRGNLYTGLVFWQASKPPYDWWRDRTETIAIDLRRVYADCARGDFRAAPASPILGHPGVDLSDIIAAASAAFPDFDFTVDCDGLPIADLSQPRTGCFQSDYDAQIAG